MERNGAGIYCTRGAAPLVQDCEIRDNTAGLSGGDCSLLVVLSRSSCRLTLEAGGERLEVPFDPPPSFPCTVELALAEDALILQAGRSLLRARVPFAWMLEGNPVLSASAPGASVLSLSLGR